MQDLLFYIIKLRLAQNVPTERQATF